MNERVASLIIQFLIRQRVDANILNPLFSTLPLRNDDYQLKKAILLRVIDTEVSNATVSTKILVNLELIEELDRREGKVSLDAIRDAYCAVAVDCTVRFLGLGSDEKYLESLRRLWIGRISKMEACGYCRLASDKLRDWRADLEAARSDLEVRERILARNTRAEAVRAVKAYIGACWEEMGPLNAMDVLEEWRNEHAEEEQGGAGSEDGSDRSSVDTS